MIRLTVKKGKEIFGEYEFSKDKITVGRLPENDIVLSMAGVSRQHAVIERRRDEYVIVNFSASGETAVNGKTIDTYALKDNDEVFIAPFNIMVNVSSAVAEAAVATGAGVGIERPKRWNVPFGANMSEEDVDRILKTSPFSEIDPSKFGDATPLRGILKNDTRIVQYKKGDIIIREGDYGNSAFFILVGSVRVVLGRGEQGLPSSILGRKKRQSKGLFRAIAQLWTNPKEAEVRDPSMYLSAGLSKRESNAGTRIFLQDVSSVLDKYNTARLKAGEIFGEIAALSRTPRTATVVAEEDSELLEIRWQGLRDIRRRAKELKEYIDRVYRKNNLRVQIEATPMFKHLTEDQIDIVVQNTIFETFGDFEWYTQFKNMASSSGSARIQNEPIVAAEGNYPDGVIMIRSGFARLSQKFGHGHRTLAYLGRGHVYGFEEIAHNWRSKQQVFLQKTVRAVGYTDVLIVPTKIMEEIVLPSLPQSELPALIQPYKSEEVVETSKALDKIGSQMMEFLVENRFINGTATMMINLERCTRCDDCVRACAAGHDNNPRFIRHGITIDKYMVANACMHCADPVCMLGCPTGAIHRDSIRGNVVINDITCIGCATCANSCPYNNIRMVEIRDKDGNFIHEKETNAPIYKATKCDLCIDQLGGPACERACPHDALKRIDMSNLELLAKWISR